jgi:hypothetical protein
MREFMVWLQGSALGHFMRDTGPWTYALVNLSHILGISSLFGSVLILDLRLLGWWPRVPLSAVSAVTEPIAKVAFGVAVLTGLGLLATKATEYLGNPFMAIKFPAIAVALLNAVLVSRTRAWRAHTERELTGGERRQLAAFGGVSLVSWLTAVAAGRMIGYW